MNDHGKPCNHRLRRVGLFRCCGLAGLLAAALILMSGCITDPAARTEIKRLMDASQAAQETVKDAFSRLDGLMAKLKPLKRQIAEAWRKLKAKEMPAAEAATIIGTLTGQRESLLAEISEIKQDIIKGKAQFETMRASAKKLQSEFNISPWVIGGSILLSLLGGATGTGLIARVGSKKLRGALQVAQSGIKIMTGALETAKPDEADLNGMTEGEKKVIKKHQEIQRTAIKKQIGGTNNAEIEAAVAEARAAVAMDTVNRAA